VSVEESSIRLLNVTWTIGALGAGVAVGPPVGTTVGLEETDGVVGVGEADESTIGPESDGITLATELPERDGDADSPDVASSAPAAMIRTTHATPRMADRLRQLVSFT
jgi:hypothetical protein